MISRWLRQTGLLEDTIAPQGDGGGVAIQPVPQGHPRQLVNALLWVLGPALVVFGIAKWPHLVSVGLLVLLVQTTNRWGLRKYGVPVGIKRIYTFGLVGIGILLAQPAIGDGIAAAVAWIWRITGGA